MEKGKGRERGSRGVGRLVVENGEIVGEGGKKKRKEKKKERRKKEKKREKKKPSLICSKLSPPSSLQIRCGEEGKEVEKGKGESKRQINII